MSYIPEKFQYIDIGGQLEAAGFTQVLVGPYVGLVLREVLGYYSSVRVTDFIQTKNGLEQNFRITLFALF